MKLPSLSHVVAQSITTAQRFPFTLISAVLFTVSGWMIIEDAGSFHYQENLLLSALLGLPLLTGVVLWCERGGIGIVKTISAQAVIFILLLAYAFTMPENVFKAPEVYIIRFLMLNAGFHLFVSFSPFMRKGELNGFWQFNKTLFLQFLTAAVYSAALFLGLVIALAAIDNLFAVNVNPKWYQRLWFAISGIFNTWFFLSNVPKELHSLEQEESYPKGLKVFTQYVLIPLVTIYLIILYAYLAKILLDWDWPKGWVGYLVLGFSTAGIFSLLLVWPVRNLTENIWINKYTKWFYVSLIPLIVLLFFAIARRIDEYGLTERRTLVVVLAVWLTGIVAYFLVSKSKSIKVIPISLAAIAVALCFGPWSVSDISKNYQLNLLEQKLVQNNILVNGVIHPASTQPSFDERKNISSIVKYLVETHGASVLQPWFSSPIDSLKSSDTLNYYQQNTTRSIVAAMGILYVEEWEKIDNEGSFYITGDVQKGFSINDYTHYLKNIECTQQDSVKTMTIENITYEISLSPTNNIISLSQKSFGKQNIVTVALDNVLLQQVKTNRHKKFSNIPPQEIEISGTSGSMKAMILFSKLEGKRVQGALRLESATFDILVGSK